MSENSISRKYSPSSSSSYLPISLNLRLKTVYEQLARLYATAASLLMPTKSESRGYLSSEPTLTATDQDYTESQSHCSTSFDETVNGSFDISKPNISSNIYPGMQGTSDAPCKIGGGESTPSANRDYTTSTYKSKLPVLDIPNCTCNCDFRSSASVMTHANGVLGASQPDKDTNVDIQVNSPASCCSCNANSIEICHTGAKCLFSSSSSSSISSDQRWNIDSSYNENTASLSSSWRQNINSRYRASTGQHYADANVDKLITENLCAPKSDFGVNEHEVNSSIDRSTSSKSPSVYNNILKHEDYIYTQSNSYESSGMQADKDFRASKSDTKTDAYKGMRGASIAACCACGRHIGPDANVNKQVSKDYTSESDSYISADTQGAPNIPSNSPDQRTMENTHCTEVNCPSHVMLCSGASPISNSCDTD